MSSNVVQLDQRASARLVSAEVRRQYLAERSKREVAAIRRNRLARLVTTKRWWWTMIGVTTVASMSIGATAVWWWQQSNTASIQAVAQVKTAPEAVTKATQSMTPKVSVVATGSPPIHSSPATVPVTTTAPLPAGRMPPGIPMAQAQVLKQAVPSPANKQSVNVPSQPATQTVQKAQPSTQYEAATASVAKPTTPAPASVTAATTTPTQTATSNASPVVANTAYQVVGVPVDGVLQIKIGKDPAIKPVRIGERLPGGEVLRRANSDTGLVETSERSFKVN